MEKWSYGFQNGLEVGYNQYKCSQQLDTRASIHLDSNYRSGYICGVREGYQRARSIYLRTHYRGRKLEL